MSEIQRYGPIHLASSPLPAPDPVIAALVEALKKADKMRDWFMHTVPEWDKSTQRAIDEYEAACKTARMKVESIT